jgi:hypothetical protein
MIFPSFFKCLVFLCSLHFMNSDTYCDLFIYSPPFFFLFSHFVFIQSSFHFPSIPSLHPTFPSFLPCYISQFVSVILPPFLFYLYFPLPSIFCFYFSIFLFSSLHFLCPVSIYTVKIVLFLSKPEVPIYAYYLLGCDAV